MKRLLKKSLALLLALTMVFGAAPLAGLVGLELPSIGDFIRDKAKAATNGVFTYKINSGEVSITSCDSSASGELEIPSTIENYPVTKIENYAFFECTSITSIIIPEGVTSIGDGAFKNCTNLTSIAIPKGTKTIGEDSFYACTSLTSITVPDSVTYIGDSAFYGSTTLKNIILSDSLTRIGNYEFYGCESLTSVTIPKSVTRIGDYSFYGCNSLTSIEIPVGVISIGNSAFKNCTILTNINIPNNVTYIGDSVFYGCTCLTNIAVPNRVTSIDRYLFYGCESLTNITIPENVKNIGDYAFYGCESLTSITIPDSVTSIGWRAFENCTGLTSITIPDSVTSISYYAFYGCIKLSSITMPESITNIGEDAFNNTEYYNDLSNWENDVLYIGKNLIRAKTSISSSYSIKEGTKIIADNAFESCIKLSSITMPESITNIGEDAFNNTGYYNDLSNWENNVLYIGKYLIEAKTSVSSSCSIKEGTKIIADNAFEGCYSLICVKIPSSVTIIGKYAFDSCSRLDTTYYAGSYTDWLKVNIDSNNSALIANIVFEYNSARPYYSDKCGKGLTYRFYYTDEELLISGTGDMYNWSGYLKTPWYSELSLIRNIIIEDGVTSIGDYAFSNCTELKSLKIPDSLISIGNYAFYCCRNITNLTLPDSLKSIGNYAFYCCGNITNLTFPDSLKSIGNYAFYCCHNLTSILLPDSLTSISDYVFYGCTGLTSIKIPESVTIIGDSAFYSCEYLTNVTIPYSVRQIGNEAFRDCYRITTAYYPGSFTDWKKISIGSINSYLTNRIVCECNSGRPYYLPGKCGSNLTYILYADGELIIFGTGNMYNWAGYSDAPWYSNRSSINAINISNGVTGIGDYAFENCSKLSNITIPESVTSIGDYAFKNCSKLSNITIPERVTSIDEGVFKGCNNLASVTIPESVTRFGDYAFNDCTSLTSLTIPESITSIGDYAFYGCISLNDIYYSDTEDEWNAITVGINNDPIINANIHYNWCVKVNDVHCFKEVINSATCKEAGESYKICEHCDKKIDTTTFPALGHSAGEWITTKEATYLASGEKIQKCTNCGTILKTVVIPKLVLNVSIKVPSTTIIQYGDSIVLRLDKPIPDDVTVVWTDSYSKFDLKPSENGETCTISPKSNGLTIITATVYDASSNVISSSAQVMTAKAGFFDKIIAFFKKIFGLTKTIPEAFKGIF